MDAVKFLEESIRMCKSFSDCNDCELDGQCAIIPCQFKNDCIECENPKKVIEVVEKWAKEHPKKTRQDEFLEHYPDAYIRENVVIGIAPCAIERHRFLKYGKATCVTPEKSCEECMEQYWTEEIE